LNDDLCDQHNSSEETIKAISDISRIIVQTSFSW